MKILDEDRLSELILELRAIKKLSNENPEAGHIDADEFIIKLLKEIKLGKIARLYDSVHKWYS